MKVVKGAGLIPEGMANGLARLASAEAPLIGKGFSTRWLTVQSHRTL